MVFDLRAHLATRVLSVYSCNCESMPVLSYQLTFFNLIYASGVKISSLLESVSLCCKLFGFIIYQNGDLFFFFAVKTAFDQIGSVTAIQDCF